MEIQHSPTLADSICDLRLRKIKRAFFAQMDTLLNGAPLSRS